ncbi:MAG: carbamoyl-phosphate synthase large subunit [Chlamydiae bacterium]|nr:carbamoyl-phosphate synthase large subunit [Chlamydiota bacterium]
MPKKTHLKKILVIGSGPTVIGQACEFDYSGTQACMALREEGYEVILINSNPATIMTDPQMADRIYMEPLTEAFLSEVIKLEHPCAILPTVGGQTALNLVLLLDKSGIFSEHGIELLGVSSVAIQQAEDRSLFREVITRLHLELPKSKSIRNEEEAKLAIEELGLPLMVRPSFILGGTGSGIAHTEQEVLALCTKAIANQPDQEILLDEVLVGWKEFEMEALIDDKQNAVIICCLENIDPLGIHTGDSITVAPAQTLTDKEYQKMRNATFSILKGIGMKNGGANVQFALDPLTGRMVVIEMNPRVSRSSALASKATGFPIAKVAAKLAVGYTLYELANIISSHFIPASFEPVLDYVVVKIPRFHFEKFKGCNQILGTQMQSVGEVMSIGRTFEQALLKAMRSLDISSIIKPLNLKEALMIPGPFRLWAIFDAFRQGLKVKEIQTYTHIDPWFLHAMEYIVLMEKTIARTTLSPEGLLYYKQVGFSDAQIAALLNTTELEIFNQRKKWKIHPVYKRVDSCSAEFQTSTSYLYASYEEECESIPTNRSKAIVLGSGPCRIGQGIEFDYCCVHALQTLKENGFETIMINCNPETVSTDYHYADKLYCSSLTAEDVLEILAKEKPHGVFLQYGGQTPLHLIQMLSLANVPLLGIDPKAIDTTENRELFKNFVDSLGLLQPKNIAVRHIHEGLDFANRFGFPVILRPSFVIGGRAMKIAKNAQELQKFLSEALLSHSKDPVLIETYLSSAIEVDIDVISDGKDVFIPGILEHIEPAGIHSGDSACCLPPYSLSDQIQNTLLDQTRKIALSLPLTGLMNIQFAIKNDDIYILEVNPRASRTVPFLSKATGLDLVKIATNCILGFPLALQGYVHSPKSKYFAIKESVFPFLKLGAFDCLLGPEMKSTGEVMGWGHSFEEAFLKSQIAAGYLMPAPPQGVALGLSELPEKEILSIAKSLLSLDLSIVATGLTYEILQAHRLPCHILVSYKQIGLILAIGENENSLRRAAIQHNIYYVTSLRGARCLLSALKDHKPATLKARELRCLNVIHG